MTLREFATADLFDTHGAALRASPLQFRDFGARIAFHGPIRTIACRRDNALLRSVLARPGDGGVLVIDGTGDLGAALVGDVIAEMAAQNGWAGLLIHGAVRDSLRLQRIQLGIKALGVTPARSEKTGAGAIDAAVSFGALTFNPGQWLYADADGIALAERPVHLEAEP
jgi:regulator of ribonuclease activity A